MKRSRTVLVGIVVVFLALVAALWWLPANWVLPLLQSRLHGLQLEHVTGSIWQGQAGQVRAASGEPLGSVRWSLSRRALLGDTQLDLQLRQAQFNFQGHLHHVSETQDEWRDVVLTIDPTLLHVEPWLHAKPIGALQLNIERVQLQGGWPMAIKGSAHWTHAAVQTAEGATTLGSMSAQIDGENGVMQATLSDDGDGALHMSGLLSFSPLGWNLQMSLKPRTDTPVLMHWLRTLGTFGADGTVQLGYRGGLAQMNPTPERQ